MEKKSDKGIMRKILLIAILILAGCAVKEEEEISVDEQAQCNYSGLLGAWGDQDITYYFTLGCKGVNLKCKLQSFTFRVTSPGIGTITFLTDGVNTGGGNNVCLNAGTYPLYFYVDEQSGTVDLQIDSVVLSNIPACDGCGLKPSEQLLFNQN